MARRWTSKDRRLYVQSVATGVLWAAGRIIEEVGAWPVRRMGAMVLPWIAAVTDQARSSP